MKWLVILASLMVLNRLRGTKLGLPGRSLYYVAPTVGLVAWSVMDTQFAMAFAVAYFVWGVGPWGRWYDLNMLPDGYGRENESPSLYERMIEAVSFGSDYVAFFLRNLSVLPGMLLLGYIQGYEWWLMVIASMVFAYGVCAMYHIGKVLVPKYFTVFGEVATGLVWGYTLLLFWSTL